MIALILYGGGGGKVQEFTDYLNNNVLKGRIVFELEPPGTELNFLNVKVRIIDGYLVRKLILNPKMPTSTYMPHQFTLPIVTGIYLIL